MDNKADTQAVQPEAPAPADTAQVEQPSEASKSSTEAPEATQEQTAVEETATPETKAEDTAEEKLLAGKYKSAEDLEKAYKELESKYGSTANEKAELTRLLNEAFTAPKPGQQVQDTAEDPYEEPTGNNEIDSLQRDVAVTKFIINHGDADAESMKQVLTTDPYVTQINGHEAKLEYAYLRSQSMSQEKALAKAKEEGQKQAQAKVAEKNVAKVESARKAEPVDEGAELLSKAAGGSPSEASEARRQLIRKHLVDL